MSMQALPFVVTGSGFAVAEGASGGSPSEILTSAGIGSLALAVGFLLLKRSDGRERALTAAARKELADERASHEKTREKLIEHLSERP